MNVWWRVTPSLWHFYPQRLTEQCIVEFANVHLFVLACRVWPLNGRQTAQCIVDGARVSMFHLYFTFGPQMGARVSSTMISLTALKIRPHDPTHLRHPVTLKFLSSCAFTHRFSSIFCIWPLNGCKGGLNNDVVNSAVGLARHCVYDGVADVPPHRGCQNTRVIWSVHMFVYMWCVIWSVHMYSDTHSYSCDLVCIPNSSTI